MSKQAPTVYVIFLITFLSIVFFIKSKNVSNFISALTGTLTILILFFILLFLGDIEFNDFLIQYFVFKDPIGRAAFKSIGAGLFGFIGGLVEVERKNKLLVD